MMPMNIVMTKTTANLLLLISRSMLTESSEPKEMTLISMPAVAIVQEFGNIEAPMYARLRHFFSTIYTRF